MGSSALICANNQPSISDNEESADEDEDELDSDEIQWNYWCEGDLKGARSLHIFQVIITKRSLSLPGQVS